MATKLQELIDRHVRQASEQHNTLVEQEIAAALAAGLDKAKIPRLGGGWLEYDLTEWPSVARRIREVAH